MMTWSLSDWIVYLVLLTLVVVALFPHLPPHDTFLGEWQYATVAVLLGLFYDMWSKVQRG